MRIDLIAPVLPPTLDGIGDHTYHLAKTLARQGHATRVLTTQRDWTPVPGVQVERAFNLDERRGVMRLTNAVQADPPDWVLLQFEQFSYGRWGLNPFLPAAMYRLRQNAAGLQVAVMFHEDFAPLSTLPFAVMNLWQRPQFWALGRLADLALFSTEPWADRYRSWFPHTNVRHLPVGSNIPASDADAVRERTRLDVPEDALLLGLFGSAHPSRLLSHVRAAVDACRADQRGCYLLYVGPDGDQLRKTMGAECPVIDRGPLPADEVSRSLSAMDVYLAPFENGVSTRRGSFLAALQHGLPTVSTRGPETGALLRRHAGTAYRLVEESDPDQFAQAVRALANDRAGQAHMSTEAQRLYRDTFDWSQIGLRLHELLRQSSTRHPVAAA